MKMWSTAGTQIFIIFENTFQIPGKIVRYTDTTFYDLNGKELLDLPVMYPHWDYVFKCFRCSNLLLYPMNNTDLFCDHDFMTFKCDVDKQLAKLNINNSEYLTTEFNTAMNKMELKFSAALSLLDSKIAMVSEKEQNLNKLIKQYNGYINSFNIRL